VTGASRGIGRAIARELGRYGATVVVNYRESEADAHAVADAITEADGAGQGHPVQADVTDADAVADMGQAIRDSFGRIDALVTNAGITKDRKFENMTAEDWHKVIDVSLNGTFYCAQTFYEDLRTADDGRLITISSVVGKQGNVGQANYAAAKSGLFGFTRSLALELAPTGSTANCITPGFTDTEMLEGVPDEIQEQLREEIPLGRFADVDEIAGLVRYLVGPDSGYITGEVIDITGGIDL
jgi:3-oxoacyl-[acyl-carrier protein] reductase